MSTEWLTRVHVAGEPVRSEDCDESVAADPSRGVWVHDPNELGDRRTT